MAGDWIKFECTTSDKPEVVQMAAELRIDQDAVVGKLIRLWVWADHNTIDGQALTITAAFIDRLTNRRGFAAAMRRAGWLLGEDGALALPQFARHNGKTAKQRAESARRMSKTREGRAEQDPDGCADVAENPQPNAQPEKRREEEEEEKSTSTPPVPAGVPAGGVRLPEAIAEVREVASRFEPTSAVPAKPDAGFVEWWWEEQEKRGFTDPQSGLPWRDWQAAFRAAWRGHCHRANERKTRTYEPAHPRTPGRSAAGATGAAPLRNR